MDPGLDDANCMAGVAYGVIADRSSLAAGMRSRSTSEVPAVFSEQSGL